ncbi:MAG: glycosyltransferase family 4 protein [Candidatus Omnitrophota bacterium]|jgi:glycosyltransferase involved in cell wall biosynthesis
MKIILVTASYPPEIRAISLMMLELAQGLEKNGHELTVITAYPRHNLSGPEKSRVFKEVEFENKVRVIRIKAPSISNVGYIARGLAQLLLPIIFIFKAKKLIKEKIDAVIVYSPPLPLALFGIWLKARYKAKFMLNIQDIFPQNAVDLGILKNKMIVKFFEFIEKKAYKSADVITTHTDTSRQFLISNKIIRENKVGVIHNWIDVDMYHNVKPTGFYRKLYNVEGKFVFLFTGVIGPSQGLDFILKVAQKVSDVPEIIFLIIGEGTEKIRLRKAASESKLNNVIFGDYVSLQEYPALVKEMDVGLVCLSILNKTPVIPGKIIGFMAASLPVVAFINKESDAHYLIQKAKAGYSSYSDDSLKAAEIIKNIYSQRAGLALYANNGYQYVRDNFSKEVCIGKIDKYINGEV